MQAETQTSTSGMAFAEPVEPRHQPFGGERRGHRNGKLAGVVSGGQEMRRLRQLVEPIAKDRQARLRLISEEEGSLLASEHWRADEFFQRLDLLTDRARGYMQLVSRLSKT